MHACAYMQLQTAFFVLAITHASCHLAQANPAALRINGSTTVNLPVAEAAEILRSEAQLAITIDTQGGSSGGVSLLGDGRIDIGMSSKPLSQTDRSRFPKISFHETRIGEDAVALIVSKDVWNGGVRSLSKLQAQGIYERRITNWSQLKGPNRRVAFFNKEPGRGTWEIFARWLYGDPNEAPAAAFPEVGGNEECRNRVGATRGAMSQLSASWADGKTVFALGIEVEPGQTVRPTPEALADHSYPMSRPLLLLTDGEPKGNTKRFVDFMLGPKGQQLVAKHGYLSLEQLGRLRSSPSGRGSN